MLLLKVEGRLAGHGEIEHEVRLADTLARSAMTLANKTEVQDGMCWTDDSGTRSRDASRVMDVEQAATKDWSIHTNKFKFDAVSRMRRT